jgi:signal transduction histidine kinase
LSESTCAGSAPVPGPGARPSLGREPARPWAPALHREAGLPPLRFTDDDIPCCVFIAPSGQILRRNQAAEAFTATYLPQGKAGVVPCLPYTSTPIPLEDLPAFRAFSGCAVANFAHDLLLPDERRVPLMVHAAPVTVGDEIVAAVITYQDISAFREIDHAKDEFLAVLSHELQTPLTSMLGFTELALEQDTLEMYRRAVPIIQRNAKRQARLVNELLDMSRLLQGCLDCRPAATDLGHLAMTMVEQMLPGADVAGVTLAMQPAHVALPVHADAKRLLTCIEHLLGNSIKFTPPGGRVTVTCHAEDGHALLTVADTGRGIDPAHLGLLFRPFQQVDRDEAAGGLGLGLAVVRGYVEWHGGTVWAASPGPGQGSTFILRLPLLP